MSPAPIKSLRGFTLVEVLVSLGIIALLAAVVVGVAGRTQEGAHDLKCLSNLRQVGVAAALYRTENGGKMGPAFGFGAANWMYALNDYVPTGYKGNAFNEKIRSGVVPNIFSCPARTTKVSGQASYGMNYGVVNARWNFNFNNIPEPSKIIYISEIQERNTEWGKTSDGLNAMGNSVAGAAMAFRHSKTNHSHVLFCDGHVESLSSNALVLTPTNGPSLWRWW